MIEKIHENVHFLFSIAKLDTCRRNAVKYFYSYSATGKEPHANVGDRQEMQVWTLGHEDPLEEGRAIYSNILAWIIPWTEEPGGLQSVASQRVRHDWSYLASKHASEENLQIPHPSHYSWFNTHGEFSLDLLWYQYYYSAFSSVQSTSNDGINNLTHLIILSIFPMLSWHKHL